MDGPGRDGFAAAFASPKLSAALVLWSLPEWQSNDAEALWFRISACRLLERSPWLFCSAPADAVISEIEHQATLLPPGARGEALAAWVHMVRGGKALELLFAALTPISHLKLVEVATTSEVGPQDVLWQAKGLAFPTQRYRRDKSVHAEVVLIGELTPRKFKGDHLVPVRDLLASDLLRLPPRARDEIDQFLDTARIVRGQSTVKVAGR
jgi:hypothetical protein